jgi:DNA-binding NarL/FixJ family response regulator
MMKSKAMNINVSIVEDDRSASQILAGWLVHAGEFNCVGQHANIEVALERLPDEKPSVVLMDINLPGMSGIEGVRQLKPLLPGTQFLMLTVFEDVDHIFDALAAGATGYLLKQTPRGELLAAIREVHAGGSPMTGNIARRVVQAFQAEADGPPESVSLSQREREVLELLARGYPYKEIMDKLDISRGSVNTYIRRVYEKLHVRSRWEAVAKFSHFSMTEARRRPSQD